MNRIIAIHSAIIFTLLSTPFIHTIESSDISKKVSLLRSPATKFFAQIKNDIATVSKYRGKKDLSNKEFEEYVHAIKRLTLVALMSGVTIGALLTATSYAAVKLVQQVIAFKTPTYLNQHAQKHPIGFCTQRRIAKAQLMYNITNLPVIIDTMIAIAARDQESFETIEKNVAPPRTVTGWNKFECSHNPNDVQTKNLYKALFYILYGEKPHNDLSSMTIFEAIAQALQSNPSWQYYLADLQESKAKVHQGVHDIAEAQKIAEETKKINDAIEETVRTLTHQRIALEDKIHTFKPTKTNSKKIERWQKQIHQIKQWENQKGYYHYYYIKDRKDALTSLAQEITTEESWLTEPLQKLRFKIQHIIG